MNRTERLKSHTGKARVARRRSRCADHHQQLLISDYFDQTGERMVPVVRTHRRSGSSVTALDRAVRVVPGETPGESASATVRSEWAAGTPRPEPGTASVAAVVRSGEPPMTLAGLVKGFLLGAVPGGAALVLYLLLA